MAAAESVGAGFTGVNGGGKLAGAGAGGSIAIGGAAGSVGLAVSGGRNENFIGGVDAVAAGGGVGAGSGFKIG